jgi:hypothetical protein
MIEKVKLMFYSPTGKKLGEEEYTLPNLYFSRKEYREFGNFKFRYSSVEQKSHAKFATMTLVYEEI